MHHISYENDMMIKYNENVALLFTILLSVLFGFGKDQDGSATFYSDYGICEWP